MKILLQCDVAHLGNAGEVKDVKDGYARNYLFPHKLAVPATATALQARKIEEARAHQHVDAARKKEKELAGKLSNITLAIRAKATSGGKLFGGIHKEAIVQELKKQGIIIAHGAISISSPIKTVGSRRVKIHLQCGVTSYVTIEIIPA